jgi:pilus assembly protein Flp/PilA
MFYVLNLIAALHARVDDAKDRGATATEYAILVAFIVIIVAGGVTVFGNDLSTWFKGLTKSVGLTK